MKKTTIMLIILLSFLFSAEQVFSKCISGNCKNGKGVYQMKNGSRYEGEFKDGKFHGKGTYFFFNGSRYEGYWENGEMSGKGTWHYANGMKLKGTFSKAITVQSNALNSSVDLNIRGNVVKSK